MKAYEHRRFAPDTLSGPENGMAKKTDSKLTVETLTHEEATRKNIPTAEYQSVMQKDDQAPVAADWPTKSRPATATWTRNWSGAARTNRTGPIWWCRPRRSTFRKRCTPRC